jgi:hypothetical protein
MLFVRAVGVDRLRKTRVVKIAVKDVVKHSREGGSCYSLLQLEGSSFLSSAPMSLTAVARMVRPGAVRLPIEA